MDRFGRTCSVVGPILMCFAGGIGGSGCGNATSSGGYEAEADLLQGTNDSKQSAESDSADAVDYLLGRCVSIEGEAIGMAPLELSGSNLTVTIDHWIVSDTNADSYVGFAFAANVPVVFAVRAGDQVFWGTSSWLHPAGTSSVEQDNSISALTFCAQTTDTLSDASPSSSSDDSTPPPDDSTPPPDDSTPPSDAQGGTDPGDSEQSEGPTGPVTPASMASRTHGVAPLLVFFDALEADEIVKPPTVEGRREYADLHYRWYFDDANAGSWATDNTSKNAASGYVAAHVFENPGDYNVALEVTTQDGATHLYGTTIVVQDPDVVYAGEATVCVSTGSDFSGCPSGAGQITTSSPGTFAAEFGPTKRVLLRRGDRWSVASGVSLARFEGPFTLGAFGSCTAPDSRGICGNAPLLEVTGPVDSVIELNRVSNVRIMDIQFVSDSDSGSAVSGTMGLSRILHLRLRSEGFRNAILHSHWITDGHDQIAIVDTDLGASYNNVVFSGSERLTVLGNRLRDSDITHVLRIWQAFKGVVSHNEISGSSVNSNLGRHALKLHGPSQTQLNTSDNLSLANPTQFVVVSHNVFGGSGPWSVSIGPQDRGSDERLSDLVVDGNRFFPGLGTQSLSSLPVQVAFRVCARNVSVRNNVFSGEGASEPGYRAMHVTSCGVTPPPVNVRLFNNTVYRTDPAGRTPELIGISVDAMARQTVARNNLFHFSAHTTSMPIEDSSPDMVADHNLMSSDTRLVDPDNPDFWAKDFRPQADSPAVDAGTHAPVHTDHLGVARPQHGEFDIGAFERVAD